jgi:hypothetical protein
MNLRRTKSPQHDYSRVVVVSSLLPSLGGPRGGTGGGSSGRYAMGASTSCTGLLLSEGGVDVSTGRGEFGACICSTVGPAIPLAFPIVWYFPDD